VDGDFSVMQHLYIDRVGFCSFGTRRPFRIRIVNAFNDNPDYFYIRRRTPRAFTALNLSTAFAQPPQFHHARQQPRRGAHRGRAGRYLFQRRGWTTRAQPIRIAKELVKFNERCFVRLLGDMRSYTMSRAHAHFEGLAGALRAMDFDQQSHHGRKNFYLPQFFKENSKLAQSAPSTSTATALQYQREEQIP